MPKKPEFDLSAFAASYGVDIDLANTATAKEIQAAQTEASRQSLSGGTLLLDSLHSKHKSMMLVCKRCKRTFMSTYCRDSFCSERCMIREFEAHYGISWNQLSLPGERWEQEPPMRLSPDRTEALYEWCREFVSQYEEGVRPLPPLTPEFEDETLIEESPSVPLLEQERPDDSPTIPAELHFELPDLGSLFS